MEKDREELSQQNVEKLNTSEMIDTKNQKVERFKTTLYLTKEAEYAYTELYIHRLRKERKTDKSKIICDALIALYEKGCPQSTQNRD